MWTEYEKTQIWLALLRATEGDEDIVGDALPDGARRPRSAPWKGPNKAAAIDSRLR